MKFTPRPYQRQIIDAILDHKRVAIWAGMGLGKTSATLAAIDVLRLLDPDPVLVLAPLRVAQSTWPDEVRKWSDFNHLKVSTITGAEAARKVALRTPADIYTTNYEQLPWLVQTLGKQWPFRMVVADEATKLKGFRLNQGGARARALGKVVKAGLIDRFVELSGTPAPNGLVDLWGQIWMLDQGERLGKTYGAFADRYFHQMPMPDGWTMLKPRAFADEQIHAALSDICFSLEAKDYFDLKEPIKNVIGVEMPAKARKVYDQLQKEAFAELGAHEITAANAAALTVKLLQAANGALYTDESGAWAELHNAKLDALESIVEEAAGMPVLVAYHFKSDLARLRARFKFARELDADPQTITDWNTGKIRMLLAHPASAGHGLNLQDGGNIIAFFGLWWDLEQHQQIIERIGPTRQLQAGYDRPVFVHYITATGTADELVLARLESKRSVQDVLMEAMKRG